LATIRCGLRATKREPTTAQGVTRRHLKKRRATMRVRTLIIAWVKMILSIISSFGGPSTKRAKNNGYPGLRIASGFTGDLRS
jgi:hypothetical protein